MTAHVTSNEIVVADRYVRQRCVWCGLLLVDADMQNLAMPTDQLDELLQGIDPLDATARVLRLVPTWPAGRLVEVAGVMPNVTTLLDDDGKYPDDSCMALDPAVTA